MRPEQAIADPRWQEAHDSKGYRVYRLPRPWYDLPFVVTRDGSYKSSHASFRGARRAIRKLEAAESQPEWWETPPVWTGQDS